MVQSGLMFTGIAPPSRIELHVPTLLVLIDRSNFKSDAQFCGLSGIDPSYFVKIKKGAKRATPEQIQRMALALDVPISVIARTGSEVAA